MTTLSNALLLTLTGDRPTDGAKLGIELCVAIQQGSALKSSEAAALACTTLAAAIGAIVDIAHREGDRQRMLDEIASQLASVPTNPHTGPAREYYLACAKKAGDS